MQELFEKEKPDIIYHLAANGNHYTQHDPTTILMANVISTFNIFQNGKGAKKIFNFSTSSVLLPEQTMYSTTKFMGEVLSKIYPNVINVRPYSIFGEGEASFRFIPTVCRSLILGEELSLVPDAVHDWVYVDNFVDVLIRKMDTDKDFEVGSGIGRTNKDIVAQLSGIAGKTCHVKTIPEMRSYDNANWVSKNPEVMRVGFSQALQNTYKFYERQFKN